MIDEYLAVRILGGAWPDDLPDDDLGLPASRHWRLLQRVHAPGAGQLPQLLAALPGGDLNVIRFPHPELIQVLDPRPLLDSAASIRARYNAGGLLVAETLAAGLAYGRHLWFGLDRNVGRSRPSQPSWTSPSASPLALEYLSSVATSAQEDCTRARLASARD